MATLALPGIITTDVQSQSGQSERGPWVRHTLDLFTGKDVVTVRVPDEHVSLAKTFKGQHVTLAVEVGAYQSTPRFTFQGIWQDSLGEVASMLTDAQGKRSS